MSINKEHLKVVIVGHVDHGKSTILGRLLADTGSLPEGKLEQIKESCRRNAKPFEYAFLLDALKNEQSQGITIDMARCFFKTEKRHYIIIDAPGHIEFLKNMCTGAAKADTAMLVIDAYEGIQENSKRHGYMLSMLGVKQVAVLINKIDLVNYNEVIYNQIVKDYTLFLDSIGVSASSYIPVSGMKGDNIANNSKKMSWYKSLTVLEQLNAFTKPEPLLQKAFRMPVQDIYKFSENNDDRRIVAGTIESGSVKIGDEVIFLPSQKESIIKNIEEFNVPQRTEARTPYASAVTLSKQIYIKPGEIMCIKDEALPLIASRFIVNLFWLGRSPMIKGKNYKLKLASTRVTAELAEIINVLDASELSSEGNKQQFDRHDVGECIIETSKPIAFDPVHEIEGTGRFVIVDDFEIAGGGVIIGKEESSNSVIQKHIDNREYSWETGFITERSRTARNHHKGKFVVFTGDSNNNKNEIAKKLEYSLFSLSLNSYYMGISNVYKGLDADLNNNYQSRDEHVRRLGELARIMTGAGLIFITSIDNLDTFEQEKLEKLNFPNDIVVINVGDNSSDTENADLSFQSADNVDEIINEVMKKLNKESIIPEYCI
jgi:bifunctional enzyme CysN/CysC